MSFISLPLGSGLGLASTAASLRQVMHLRWNCLVGKYTNAIPFFSLPVYWYWNQYNFLWVNQGCIPRFLKFLTFKVLFVTDRHNLLFFIKGRVYLSERPRVHTIQERIVPHRYLQQTEISALFTQPFLWCLDVYITAVRNIFLESPNLHEIDLQAISLKIQSVEEICVKRFFLIMSAL